MSALGTMCPKCADLTSFKRQYGGWPIYCSSREEVRRIRQGFKEDMAVFEAPEDERTHTKVQTKLADAGKDKTHFGSFRDIPGGTRWAVNILIEED